jgi:hypothetical protein
VFVFVRGQAQVTAVEEDELDEAPDDFDVDPFLDVELAPAS